MTKAPRGLPQLTAEKHVPGFNRPRWIAYPIAEAARADVEDSLRWHSSRLAPAEAKVVIAALWRLANHHKKDRTAREWEELFHDFVEDLSEFGGAHVIEALAEHRRESKWFPKPAEIRARCERMKAIDTEMLHRARVLLELEPPRFFEVPSPVEDEGNVVRIDSARIDAMFAEMRRAPKFEAPVRDLAAERADRLALAEARKLARAAVAKHPKLKAARETMKKKRAMAK